MSHTRFSILNLPTSRCICFIGRKLRILLSNVIIIKLHSKHAGFPRNDDYLFAHFYVSRILIGTISRCETRVAKHRLGTPRWIRRGARSTSRACVGEANGNQSPRFPRIRHVLSRATDTIKLLPATQDEVKSCRYPSVYLKRCCSSLIGAVLSLLCLCLEHNTF